MPNDGNLQIPNQILMVPNRPAPGRSVADPEEMKLFMAKMKIPSFPDANGYISFLDSKIQQVDKHWEHYAHATNEAYANAWQEQASVLKEVKKRLEIRAKREEALATFALNLLTVGIGGPLAGQAVKIAVKGLGGSEKFVEKAVDLAKEKVSEPIQKGTEWGYKKLAGELSEDPFEPAAVSPAAFGSKLLEGISRQTGMLLDMVVKLKTESANGITLAGAKALCEQIIPGAFVQDMPSLDITASTIQPKASLALWLSWGWARDEAYWNFHGWNNDFGRNTDERLDYEPVRKALNKAGVPRSATTQKDTVYHWGNSQEIVDEICMPAFIQWCNGTDWIRTMAEGMPNDNFWVQKLPQQYAQIKVKRLMSRFVSEGSE